MKIDFFKIIIAITLLIIALSVAYYFVIFLPQKENQKIELQRLEAEEEKTEAEQKKKEAESKSQLLSICLGQAESTYSSNWNNECKSQGKLTSECIKLIDMSLDDYIEENNIPDSKRIDAVDEFFDKKSDCSCRLPLDNADRIEEWKKADKEECHIKYGN